MQEGFQRDDDMDILDPEALELLDSDPGGTGDSDDEEDFNPEQDLVDELEDLGL
jgi:hypothetical protein